jgi:hypothetical protein
MKFGFFRKLKKTSLLAGFKYYSLSGSITVNVIFLQSLAHKTLNKVLIAQTTFHSFQITLQISSLCVVRTRLTDSSDSSFF